MGKTDRAFMDCVQSKFSEFAGKIARDERIAVACHNDVDGLAAGSILGRSLAAAGSLVSVFTTGKAQTPWSPEIIEKLAAVRPAGVIVADFSPRSAQLLPGIPALIIDHHRPEGLALDTEVISGYGKDPTPTSGLLAFWACEALGDTAPLRWLAALSILGDLAESGEFPELDEERVIHGQNMLREATSLLNAPRRSSSGDATPALDLLLKANSPVEIIQGRFPEVAQLKRARSEVQSALQRAKMAAPTFSGGVALVRIDTPCQVHPIIAQIWRTRLKKYIVMCANSGYRPGYVHFSVRSATGANLLDFLKEWAPAGADEHYGGGHDQATGGALRIP
ncbi:MAG: DHH family phosphoesterase, partial [Acidobacteria bacterium]